MLTVSRVVFLQCTQWCVLAVYTVVCVSSVHSCVEWCVLTVSRVVCVGSGHSCVC